MGFSDKRQTVLVTGATGMIGQNLVRELLGMGHTVIAAVRDREKANRIFAEKERLSFLVGDVTKGCSVKQELDYIIHGASQTSSKAFVNEPVETIRTALLGTEHLLRLAREKKVKGFAYLSTMEVYGAVETDEKVTEAHAAYLDTMEVRSSYPESKRMCESMCRAYCSEHGVPVKTVRLAQTFGKGVSYHDGRVFAEFARCVIEGRDIVLHTKGETRRSYLSMEDAVSAILTVLFCGDAGEAYNAANEETYCSIYEMAKLAANGRVAVRVEEGSQEGRGYAPTLHMNLDASKLEKLGWKATKGLRQMYEELIEDMRGQIT